MRRRNFMEMGGLLAATMASSGIIADKPWLNLQTGATAPVDFIFDGISLSPVEYATLLTKLIDEGKVRADDYSNGGVVEELEFKFAALLGKESAVFMPTGTLANHIAIRKLAGEQRRVVVQEQSHFYNDCGDNAETLSGIKLLPAAYNAVEFTVDDVIQLVNRTKSGRVATGIGVISIESPVRRLQDRMFSYDKMVPIIEFARANGIKTHLDGARLFVQAVHTDMAPAQYGALFDTVYTSMYKCFNAPAGAILAGDKSFTGRLFHERRMFGGGLHAAWPFAAIALHYADTFMTDYKTSWEHALQFFALLNKEERFVISTYENGSHIVKLQIDSADLHKFKIALEKRNIYLSSRTGNDLFLKINPTIRRMESTALVQAFKDALKEVD